MGSAANRTAAAGSFAVFFDGPGAFGTHPVYAIAAEHAVEIASAFYPGSRLAAWLSTEEESQPAQQPPAQTSPIQQLRQRPPRSPAVAP